MKQINKYLQAEASTNKDRVTIQALSSQGENAGTVELTRAELAEVNRLVEINDDNDSLIEYHLNKLDELGFSGW